MKPKLVEPCRECGEPVHPIAGRCKHCGADLVAYREAERRAARAAARAAAATPTTIAGEQVPVGGEAGVATLRVAPAAGRGAPRAHRRLSAQTKLLLAAAAVLVLGIAGGVVAQRAFAGASAPSGNTPFAVASAVLEPVEKAAGAADPDVDYGVDPRTPRGPLDPGMIDPMDPLGSADPMDLLAPFFGLPGGGGGLLGPSRPARPPRSGGPLPDVSRPEHFAPAMAEVMCGKLAECGLFDAGAADLCAMLGQGLGADLMDEALKSGQCRYDAAAAKSCLQAMGGMSCDSVADPSQLLALADGFTACSQAYACN